MENRYKEVIGKEVSPIVPDATADNEAVNLGQVKSQVASSGKTATGSVLALDRTAGTNYNYAAPSAALEYTIEEDAQGNKKIVVNGHAPCAVNAPSEPKVKLSSGTAEEASLQITAAPTTAGNVTVTLDGVSTNIAVDPAVETTKEAVADKIRGTAFSGWTTGGTVGTDSLTFTCDTVGVKTDATYADGGTGATGTMTTTTQGVDNTYATKISGADFVANSDMELIVESKDGQNVRYFFLNASAV